MNTLLRVAEMKPGGSKALVGVSYLQPSLLLLVLEGGTVASCFPLENLDTNTRPAYVVLGYGCIPLPVCGSEDQSSIWNVPAVTLCPLEGDHLFLISRASCTANGSCRGDLLAG